MAFLRSTIEEGQERWQDLLASGLDPTDLLPTRGYLATLHVLRDLVTQGWRVRGDDEGMILDSPAQASLRSADPEQRKEAIRRSFSFARDAQLGKPSTARFVERMERQGVSALFADGAELVQRLERFGTCAIKPEVEVIDDPGRRDEATGLLLQDVWRYARHFWSIPYQSTPGRNMFFLVRDAGVVSRPLIGIAAFGNAVLGLSQRDDFYGWSPRGLRDRLRVMTPDAQQAVAAHIWDAIEESLDEVYRADLPSVDLCNWEKTVAQLEAIERQSARARLEGLGGSGNERSPEYKFIRAAQQSAGDGNVEGVDWVALAKTALYRRKRAGTLADLVRAKGTLLRLGFSSRGGSILAALATENGCRAVEIALRRIKQRAMTSNVMDLITCGAVPPYRDVLGGKLVAMLILSGEVVGAFQEKYTDQVSLIASALAGRPIRRPARLALVTTSSLYALGSSQYNRLKVQLPGGELAYRRIGVTDSFGTVHFADDTVAHLGALARLVDSNRRQVNNLFGEGTSPKLRLVRSGLEALGLQSDTFLRHHSPRLLYGAALCANIHEIVLGFPEEPSYLLPAGSAGTELLAGHWRDRWLANRGKRPDVLEKLSTQRFDDFRLGKDVEAARNSQASALGIVLPAATHGGMPVDVPDAQLAAEHTFVERLYRSTKSYADRLNRDELEMIHVDLGVDAYLLEQAKARRQIIITGNPGDGKTHLIDRLRPELEAQGAAVIRDANACSDEEILETWATCRKKRRPFVMAINEWPLYVLRRTARQKGFAPVDEAIRQVTGARFYMESQTPEPPKDGVVVIDLSLRNLLSPKVVDQVIERLTQDRFYKEFKTTDPALRNRTALLHKQVRDRLEQLLQLVGQRVGHATMRQLVGFISFLLTGGQSETDRIRAGQDPAAFGYSQLAFAGGVGTLFDAVRAVLDPAAVTHPAWDERLWCGATQAAQWLWQVPPAPLTMPEAEREQAFRVIKRAFFFEHASGAELLTSIPKDEREFEDTLGKGSDVSTSLVRELVLALNRFFEPDCSDDERERLQLWQSHRYDVRAPAAFLSLHALPHHDLRIERLRVAPWVDAWLPQEQQQRRSFALVATAGDQDVAMLEVSRDLFLTLVEAERGLGRSSWARTATRRVTRFVDQVHRAVERSSAVEDLRIRNVESDLDDRFSIQRKPARYQL